jgi:CRISPR-associated protein Cas1
MEILQNTLYVMTQGAYVHRDHLAIIVEVEKIRRLAVPIHNLQAIAVFGSIMVSPGAMELCATTGVSLTFLSESGRMHARVDGPVSGNVLLRREQFRQADLPEKSLFFARAFIAGKLQNARATLMRAARDNAAGADQTSLSAAANELAASIRRLESAENLNEVRGIEGAAARRYFEVFSCMVRHGRETFAPKGRTRRPPLDPTNALLSFSYALLLSDCVAGLASAGLDPNVGFLHTDRPGRPSLALDLMEEFRTLAADRVVLTLINRKQVSANGFTIRTGGAVEMSAETRKTLVTAWQERKQEMVTHPLLEQSIRVGLLPSVQARILARAIRGEIDCYVPCILK